MNRWHALKMALLTFAAVAFILVSFDGMFGNSGETALRWLTALAIPTLLAALIWAISRTNSMQIRRDPPGEEVEPLEGEITEARERLDPSNQLDRLILFWDVLTTPDSFIERVIEDASIDQQNIQLDSLLHINIPEDNAVDGRVWIPLWWVRKGALLHNLSVENGQRHMVPLIPQMEAKAAISLMTEPMFSLAYLAGNRPTTDLAHQSLREVNRCVWATGIIDASEALRLLDQMAVQARLANTLDSGMHASFKRLCELFSNHYVLVAEVKTGSRIVLRCRRTTSTLRQEPPGTGENSFLAYLRLMLGARPQRVVIPIDLPFSTNSYHFRMTAESGQFISDHTIFDLDNPQRSLTPRTVAPGVHPQPYVRFQSLSGLPHTHLYMRGMGKVANLRLATAVSFTEVPPGVLGFTTLASSFISTMLVGFTLLQSHYDIATDLPPAFPGFLLAFLAFAVSWLGFSSDRDTLLRSSLTARLGLVAVVVLSLSSALLFTTLKWLKGPLWHFSLYGGLWKIDVNSWWFVLSCISLTILIYLLINLFSALNHYDHYLKQR
ncbi:hypothetical protein [Streptomyces gardneri]|uniref:hypothetical protein n=1 Tax=Streptomyces gardneri TaxID=66892 RepID=UPI0035E100DA